MMIEKNLILLLRHIFGNWPMEILINEGYTYSQIAVLLKKLQTHGFCDIKSDGRLSLTEKGAKTLKEQCRDCQYSGGPAEWIKPQTQYRRFSIEKYDIILPKKV